MDVLRHLHYFAVVAEEGHVGRAATRLLMAQPPLSQAVARLERSLGVPLFRRGPRGMTLTDAGRALLPRARALLDDEQALRRAAADLADTVRTVRIGCVPAVGARLATELAAAAAGAHEHRVDLVVAPTRDLVDALGTGDVDLALVAHPVVVDGPGCGPVAVLPADVLLPRTHPAAIHGGPVSPSELGDLAPVLTPRTHEPAAYDVLADALDLAGCTRRPLELDPPAAGLAAVATGRAFLLTADPDLDAAGVARRTTAGAALLLRFRLVWRRPEPPAEVLDAVQRRLDAAVPDAR